MIPSSSIPVSDRDEVIVKIDCGDKNMKRDSTAPEHNKLWHESSYQFWKSDDNNSGRGKDFEENPPTKLAVDLEMGELGHDHGHHYLDHPHDNNSIASSNGNIYPFSTSKDVKVSLPPPKPLSNMNNIAPDEHYKENNNDIEADDQQQYLNRRKAPTVKSDRNADDSNNTNSYTISNISATNGGGDKVIRCSSFQTRGKVLERMKTKSRLVDPPQIPERKSGPLRSRMSGRVSGTLGNKLGDEELEDDPLFDEDIPEEFKKGKSDALTLLQWISLVVIVTSLVCTLTIPLLKRKRFRGLDLWKWEVLVLVLICGRLVSGWVIKVVVFFIERNFVLRKRVLYFVYGVRKAVQNCFWLGLVLIAWHFMFDAKVDGNNKFLRFVNKIMLCMLVGTMLWLVKTLMVKVLASSFHVSTFFDRIQDSLFNQYVIETLSGPPLIQIKNTQEEDERTQAEIRKLQDAGAEMPPELRPLASQFNKSRRANAPGNGGASATPKLSRTVSLMSPLSKNQDVQQQGISIDHLHKLNPKNISAWNMKRLIKIVRYGVISTLDEQLLDATAEDESARQIRSEFEAKVAARKIFRNVAKPRSKFIDMEDLRPFLKEDEALKAMNLVEGSPDSEMISKKSLMNWVVNAFQERKSLALTLNDTKTAVNKLHQMLNVLVGVIIVLISLVILGIATSKFLLFISSQLIVVVFIFGNTCKLVFEGIIFLFVTHPFDVGDRCEIDGVQMIVEEINILNTVFLRFDNLKVVFPNSILANKSICNYYRSPDMTDTVDFSIHIATSPEKIVLMNQRIISYIEGKLDHWYPSPSIVLTNLMDLNKLKMSVWVKHRMNHQNMGERWQRRAQLIEEMVKIFKELDIIVYPQDIHIRSMPPLSLL